MYQFYRLKVQEVRISCRWRVRAFTSPKKKTQRKNILGSSCSAHPQILPWLLPASHAEDKKFRLCHYIYKTLILKAPG